MKLYLKVIGLPGYTTLSAKLNKTYLSLKGPSPWIWPLIFCPVFLASCIAPLAALGSSGTAAASSVGTAATTAAVANPMTATSIVSTAATGKSPLEHAASAATKKECSFLNVVGPKPICEDVPIPTINDKSEVYLGPADKADAPAK
jgi:hypothetical protein